MFEIHQTKFHVIINHEITVLPKKTNVKYRLSVQVVIGYLFLFSKAPYLKWSPAHIITVNKSLF